MIKTGQILEYALEEEEAKSFIFDETGISPKFSVGTRVIIPNPTDDLILDIENGNMEKYIQESWWISLQHLKDNAGVFKVKKIHLKNLSTSFYWIKVIKIVFLIITSIPFMYL